MLWLLFVILILAWLSGNFIFAAGSLIHLLLVIALIVLVIELLGIGRGPREPLP